MLENATDQTKDKVSLKEFIEEYHKTITVSGALIAIGILWKGLEPQNTVPYVSWLAFGASVFLLIEVCKGYKYETASWNLFFFMSFFQGVLLFSGYNLIAKYPEYLEQIIIGLIWSATGLTCIFFIERWVKRRQTEDYQSVVDNVETLRSAGVDQDKINEFVSNANGPLKRGYKLVNLLQMLLLLMSLVISFLVVALVSPYINRSFDIYLDRGPNPVVEPVKLD